VKRAAVRGQIFDPFVGPSLFVGAIEILQRERHIVDEPLPEPKDRAGRMASRTFPRLPRSHRLENMTSKARHSRGHSD
jgi:hypothetical protein